MNKTMALTLLVLFSVGAITYGVKQRVIQYETSIVKVKRELHKLDETIHILKAEWSYLNRPERLQALATKYTPLAFNPDAEFVSLQDLEPIIDTTPVPFQEELTIEHLIHLTNAETD